MIILMVLCDFVVRYDPKKDTIEDISKRIIQSLFIGRLKQKKPCIIFIAGGSGEGKSWGSVRLQEELLEEQGLNLDHHINTINVFTPLEYAEKLDALLYNKEHKKVNIICVHEARELINAKEWYNFLNRAIGDVNAMSRRVKRLIIIIISQSIKDISNDVRHSIHYYCKAARPRGKRARIYIKKTWLDDRDLEKPKLRKRGINGFIVYPDDTYRRCKPPYLELSRPRKVNIDFFEKADFESKSKILKNKIQKLIMGLKKELEIGNEKLETMVDFYSTHTENLTIIGKQRKNKWLLKPEVKKMHDLTDQEVKTFQDQLNEKLKEKGVIGE